MLQAGLVPKVSQLILSDVNDVRKEALWVLSNAAVGGTEEQLEALAEAGAVAVMTSVLDSTHDTTVLVAVLDGLKACLNAGQNMENRGRANVFTRIVEEAEGLTKLEQLQEDAHAEVYQRAVHIIENFFEAVDDETEAAAAAPTGAFDFA